MEPTERWTPQFASDLYDVASWGKGYFSVGDNGHVRVHPKNRFWTWAGPSGSANRQVLNNATAQWIGVPGATKLTSDVLAQADTQAKRLLDLGRNADNILMFHPQTVGSGVLQAAVDAGYPTAAAGDFTKNPIVTRLLETLENGSANGEELGNLASQLGAEAKAKISSDHTLGSALFNTKGFVESLISEGYAGRTTAVHAGKPVLEAFARAATVQSEHYRFGRLGRRKHGKSAEIKRRTRVCVGTEPGSVL